MKTKIFLIFTLSLILGNTYALKFNDGYVHDVNYVVVDNITYIQNDPFWDYPTTVNLLAGGNVHLIQAFDESELNIVGGFVDNVLYGFDDSRIYMQDGNISGSIVLQGYSDCIIENGIFSPIDIQMHGYSKLKIYNGLFVFNENNNLSIDGYSIVTIYGNDFKINNRGVQSGIYTNGSGVLTGNFIEGSSFIIPFSIDSPSQLILAPEIEPYCIEYPTMDFNKDCQVNLIDFAEFASQWMICNLEPQSFCF
jgi:hypothetical protein